MSPLQRLELALLHLEAAADGDPGRAGLAYMEVVHARNDLRLEEERPTFHAADDLGGGDIEAAATRTLMRLLEVA